MEARASHRYIPSSPRKMRLMIDLIKGKGVEEAISILHFTPNHASEEAEKTLRSAVANIQNQEDTGRIDFSDLYIKEAFVDGGPTLKRMLPAPMGRAYRVRKRSNHLTIVVAVREGVLKENKAKKARKKPRSESTEKPQVKEEETNIKE